MTTERAIKALSKYAKVEKTEYGMYFAIRNDKDRVPVVVSFYNVGGNITALHYKRVADKDDANSDYFPGGFAHSMPQVLHLAWDIETHKNRINQEVA